MLQNLHVKNLALIQEIEVDFVRRTEYPDRRNRRGKIHHSRFDRSGSGWKIYSQDMLRTGADYGSGRTVLFCGRSDGSKRNWKQWISIRMRDRSS